VLLGELGLDGRLRPVGGVLPATLAAQQAGLTRVIVPLRQAGEANLVEGVDVFGLASITQLIALFQGVPRSCSARTPTRSPTGTRRWPSRMPTVEPAQLGAGPLSSAGDSRTGHKWFVHLAGRPGKRR
jgi:predicted ATPase with chaperone activity